MRLMVLLSIASSLGFAGTWSGALVSASCYASEERNVTIRSFDANHDRTFEITQCEPNAKTKVFAVVQQDGQAFNLDAQGNAKAVELIGKAPKKGRIYVEVSGRKSGGTVAVNSISQQY